MMIAGRCERAPRAIFCGRDHPGKALPELCAGGPVLLLGTPPPSSLLLSKFLLLQLAAMSSSVPIRRIYDGDQLPICGMHTCRFRSLHLPSTRAPGRTSIDATIFVEQESQKGIVIGKGGSALKALGTAARADIEQFLGAPACKHSLLVQALHPSLLGLHGVSHPAVSDLLCK